MAVYHLMAPDSPLIDNFLRGLFSTSFQAMEIPTQEQCQAMIDAVFTEPRHPMVYAVDVPESLFQYLRPHRVQRKVTLNDLMVTGDAKDCTICMRRTRRRHCRLPCGHCFHKTCISRWLTEAETCPVCRAHVPL